MASSTSRPAVDPVLLQVIGAELHSIAKEMAQQMKRSAYSVIIRESEDFGCTLLTPECEAIAESDNTPFHVGSNIAYLRGVLDTLAERKIDLLPGDVLIHNHPFYGASHSLDVAVIAPIFYKDELLAFAVNNAHLLDIGGAQPGAAIELLDVWAEGRLFRANFLYRGGQRCDDMWHFFADNTRAPREVIGDLQCQVAAVNYGVRRYLELVEKYGVDVLQVHIQELLDYGERLMRAEIAKIPDGEYYAEGWLDDNYEVRDKPEKIGVKVIVEGDNITVDLTDSPPQRPNSLNTPFGGSTCVAVYALFRSMLLDSWTTEKYIPTSSGLFRPIKVVAPEGTIFNPKFPAATQIRFNPANRMADLIIQALAPVMPNRVTAGNSAQLNGMYMSGVYPDGSYWITIEVDEGAYGGRPDKDGMDAVDCLSANIRNQPIEELEMHYPFRFYRYELVEGAAGAGKWRGGTSAIREYEFKTPAWVTTESERHSPIDPPPGLFGGKPGRVGEFWKIKPDGTKIKLYSKENAFPFDPGDRLRIIGVTGGGYGDPLERDPERVLNDYLDELITYEQALNDYGVVIENNQINWEATEKRRAELRKQNEEQN